MSTNQADRSVELVELGLQPVVSIRATVPVAALNEAQAEMLHTLSEYLQRSGAQPSGPPFVRYHTFGDSETDMEMGVPMAEPAAGEGRVAVGSLPAGPAISTWHVGAHDRLGEAYERIQRWLKEHSREANSAGWEVYAWIDPSHDARTETWPNSAEWRTAQTRTQ